MNPSHQNAACRHIQIAHSKLGEVVICPECGVVHLNLQSISLRLEVEAFAVLSSMLVQAQEVLERARNQQSQDHSRHAGPDMFEKMTPDLHHLDRMH